MMRLTMGLFWSLLAWSLLASGDSARVEAADAAPTPGRPWPTQVDGFILKDPDRAAHEPEDLEKARQIALKNAQKEVTEYLRALDPAIKYWSPTLDFIEQELLDGRGRQGADFTPADTQTTFMRWVLTLKSPDHEMFRKLDRAERAKAHESERETRRKERLVIAGKATLALLVLVALVAGYIQFDEWTRRAYTPWLKLALVSVLVAAGAGLWMLK